jgi:hypothetical protein
MGERKRRKPDPAGRTRMRSPGRRPAGRREHRPRFWAAIARGPSCVDAAVEAGVSAVVRPVVSGGWRDAAVCVPGLAVGALSIVRRAVGDRVVARPEVWGAGDRTSAWSFAVDDLAGAAPERRDP